MAPPTRQELRASLARRGGPALLGAALTLGIVLLASVGISWWASSEIRAGREVPPNTVGVGEGWVRGTGGPVVQDPFVSVPVAAVTSYDAGWQEGDTHHKYPFSAPFLIALLATIAGARLSVVRLRPSSARDAVVQGVLTSLPHAAGVAILAIVASSDLRTGPYASFGFRSVGGFDVVAAAAVALLTGIVLGAVTGLVVWKRTTDASWRDAVSSVGSRFTPQAVGGIVAVTVAFGLALLVAGFGVARLIEDAPKQGVEIYPQGEYVTHAGDVASSSDYATTSRVLRAPWNAVEVLGVAHGVTLEHDSDYYLGETHDSGTLSLPAGSAIPWWLYAAALIPAIACFVGGSASAAVSSRPRASLPFEGARIAAPYAALMLGLGWLASGFSASPEYEYTTGFDLPALALAALAWGLLFGWLGGKWRQSRLPREPAALAAPEQSPQA